MFKNLINFGYKRNKKEAFGFYLAYLLLFIVVGAVIGAIVGVTANGSSILLSLVKNLAIIFAALASIALSFTVLHAKKSMNFGWILLALLSGILGVFGGGLLGIIIPACFTTFPASTDSAVQPATSA